MKKTTLLISLMACLGLGGPLLINNHQTMATCYAATKKTKKVMRTPINWQKPSEYLPYPDLKKYHHINIYVSLKKQRVYIRNNNKVLYTMYASTGANSGDQATPTGTYHIQPERGHFFYNAKSKEGAFYWVSWQGHGIYLFHTVPADAQGHFITKEADKLGKKASSHGCIRLAVPDAKWLYENIPKGTKVVISKK